MLGLSYLAGAVLPRSPQDACMALGLEETLQCPSYPSASPSPHQWKMEVPSGDTNTGFVCLSRGSPLSLEAFMLCGPSQAPWSEVTVVGPESL